MFLVCYIVLYSPTDSKPPFGRICCRTKAPNAFYRSIFNWKEHMLYHLPLALSFVGASMAFPSLLKTGQLDTNVSSPQEIGTPTNQSEGQKPEVSNDHLSKSWRYFIDKSRRTPPLAACTYAMTSIGWIAPTRSFLLTLASIWTRPGTILFLVLVLITALW